VIYSYRYCVYDGTIDSRHYPKRNDYDKLLVKFMMFLHVLASDLMKDVKKFGFHNHEKV
jgi:hypothetical protein